MRRKRRKSSRRGIEPLLLLMMLLLHLMALLGPLKEVGVVLDGPQKLGLAPFGQGGERNARSEPHLVAVKVHNCDCVWQLVGHQVERLRVATQEKGDRAVGAQVEALSRQDGDEHMRVGQGPHARRQQLGHGGKEGELGAVQEDLLLEEDGIKGRQQVFWT